MNINRACHSVFCGRLEARFPGEMILYTTRPGLGLAKPCKSRLFSCLTVHSRPPFPFTFCFLPPVNSGGAVRGSIFPGWIWGRTRRRRPHSISNPCPGRSPLPASRRAARPPTETIYSRPRKKPSAGRCRCPHRQGQCSRRPHSYSTPAVSRRWPVSFVLVSCGRVCRPAYALTAAGRLYGFSSMRPSICFPLPFSPKRLSAPFLRRVPALARSHSFGPLSPKPPLDTLSRSRLPACFPRRIFLFGRSFCFQGAVHR